MVIVPGFVILQPCMCVCALVFESLEVRHINVVQSSIATTVSKLMPGGKGKGAAKPFLIYTSDSKTAVYAHYCSLRYSTEINSNV